MSNGVFKCDGIDYNVSVVGLDRNFEVADTDATGRTADWKMHRDVVGTFYNYTLKIVVKNGDYDSYNRFYSSISAPNVSHDLIVPWNSETLRFDAYVTKGKDKLVLIKNGIQRWDGLSINFIAMEPQRRA